MAENGENETSSLLARFRSAFGNTHFWVLLAIVFVLSAFYYSAAKTPHSAYSQFPFIRSFIIFEFSHTLNGSLFYIPFIYSAIVFWRKGTLLTTLLIWIVSLILMQPYILAYTANSLFVLNNNLFLSIPLLLIALITLELKLRQREKKILAEREIAHRAYLAQVIQAQEDERKRISQEIHDDSIQTLLVAANRLQAVITDVPGLSSDAKGQLESTRDTVLRVTEDMRRLSLDLRPSILDNLGLLSALRWLNDRFCEDTHVESKLDVIGEERKLSPFMDVFIFRLIQEALNNIRKHAEATQVEVKLEFQKRLIKLIVQDNGKGFDLPDNIGKFTAKGKMGLAGMQERTRLVNGILNIHTFPGKGTLVSVTIFS